MDTSPRHLVVVGDRVLILPENGERTGPHRDHAIFAIFFRKAEVEIALPL